MGNVLRVFRRDVKRLFRAPAAVVVVIVLITLPSLYTWINVIGFWNPYDNTGNLRVCVVNEDAGANTDVTGQLNLGDQIVDQLSTNTQLGWTFTDRDTAMAEVESGKAYAAFIIPSDFSYDFTTILTGSFTQPALEYYVNEKAGAVSPKITDTGATSLEETINSAFVSQASGIIAQTIDNKLADSQGKIDASQSDLNAQMGNAKTSVAEARAAIAGLTDATKGAQTKTDEAKGALQRAKDDIATLDDQIDEVSTLAGNAQNKLGTFSSDFISSMDQGSLLASQAAARAETAVGKLAGTVKSADGDVNAAIESGQAAVEQNAAIIEQLKSIEATLPEGDTKSAMALVITDLENQNASLKSSLDDLEKARADAEKAADSISTNSSSVDETVQSALASADGYRSALYSTILPALNNGLAQIGSTAASLKSATSNQSLLVDQAALVLDQLTSTLGTTTTALGQTDALLASLQSSLDTVQTDITALNTSSALANLFGENGIDASKVADFMLSPTEIRTESLYPLNAYGSAMAPLFTNLTLWIGVFMLMVILKLEVDDEGVEGLTISQRYWARWLFFVPIVALQAIVCCAGNLYIGVQTVNVTLYFLTAVITALTYLSIQYALSTTLQHIGKGICVILVFTQIPGATGLYPIEMTPRFFQIVYPVLPFTYGINAMRETIAGFYGTTWGQLMGVLMVFMVASFLIGLLIRPYFTNLNRLFAREIGESDIFNGEEAQTPARRFRLGQLIQVLSDRDEYRTKLETSANRFLRWYPRLKNGAWVFGIGVPTVTAVIFSLAGGERVTLLTVWLAWLIVVIMFLVIVEHIRDSLERQTALGGLSDEELRTLFSSRSKLDDDAHAAVLDPEVMAGEMTTPDSPAYVPLTPPHAGGARSDDAHPSSGSLSDDKRGGDAR